MDSVPSVGGRSTHCTGGFVERPPVSTGRHMTFAAHGFIARSLALAGLVFILSACTESGSGANPIAAANTVTVSGTVNGTRIVAMNDNDNLLFVDFSSGRIRRIVLSGADGFVYVSNTNAIFKVVPQ
jgi:hypothetical protein